MEIDERFLEVRAYQGPGYQPLVDYGEWRVAILRWIDDLIPEKIEHFQRHDQTDEVFVLLGGRCILFLGEGEGSITRMHAVEMKPLTAYNVRKGCWHTHTLSQDANILVIENRDTTRENSGYLPLAPDQRRFIAETTHHLLGETTPDPLRCREGPGGQVTPPASSDPLPAAPGRAP